MDNGHLNCGHDNCGACCGGSCNGCGGELELTQTEVDLLRLFAQIPFLPVAWQSSSGKPAFFDSSIGPGQDLGDAVDALYQKRLIQLDYDLPLLNFDYSEYEAYSRRGSMALTAMGQQAVELLEIYGIEE